MVKTVVPEQDCGLSGHKTNTFLVGDGSESIVSRDSAAGEDDAALQVVPAAGALRALWPIAVGRSRAAGLKGAAAVGVLMALWMHSDFGTGRRAWPSASKLAAFARSDEKTARRALQAAVDAGYVVLVRRGGGRGRTARGNEYALTMPVEEAKELREIAGDKTLAKLSDVSDSGAGDAAEVSGVSEPLSGDSAETPDILMSDVVAETPDILTETPDISAGNSGHLDVRQPSPRTSHREGRARASRDVVGPDPLRESNEPRQTGAADADASSAPGKRPAEQCQRHLGLGWVEKRCGDCARAKEAAKQWDAGEDERRAASVRAKRRAVEECARCDEYGQIDLGDSVAKCTHPGVVAA